ncbi:NADPH-dependent diflavin oxidoreductase 1 isoform X2 [Aristolochia californica]
MVIFIVSTTGQGDTPDSMKVFWRFLLQKNLGPMWLERVHYAVFGLGDSGYQKYNFTAKKLDKRLADLGARLIIEKGLGDDQHPSGYEGALDPWLSNLWTILKQSRPSFFRHGLEVLNPAVRTLDHPKFRIIYHDEEEAQSLVSSTSDLKSLKLQIGRARAMSPGLSCHDDDGPQCVLHMTKNRHLTKMGCGRDVRHFELEALSSVIEYQLGDVVEILPGQNPDAVDAFLRRCNLNPDAFITVEPNGSERCVGSTRIFDRTPVHLRNFVELTMDVASASPRRYFFEVMSFFATAEHEKEKLQYFGSPEGRDDLYLYNQKERRTVLEVLEDFPSVHMPFEWLVQLIPPLKTRAFSISSSPSAHPNQVHLTVSIVSWMTPFKRKRSGLCSSWLAGLDPKKGVRIPAWFKRGSLPPPPSSLPLILIGPGTGCAPFRAFVEDRAIQRNSWPIAPTLFFFGCRNETSDFLYRDFWLSHTNTSGVLSEEMGGGFFVAFSRDQPQKVYVQHKMREESERVWALLTTGAAVYIAGSSTKMPADVFSCMEEIVAKESGLSREMAARWLRKLEKDGRYYVDTWS